MSKPEHRRSSRVGRKATSLFLVQLPPPRHGATLVADAIRRLLEADGRVTVEHLWGGSARTIADIGRKTPGKLVGFAALLARLLARRLLGRRADTAYLSFTPWAHTAVRDALVAMLAKGVADRVLVHVHCEGLDAMIDGTSRRDAFLRRAFAGTELVAITGETARIGRESGLFRDVHLLYNHALDPGEPPMAAAGRVRVGWFGRFDPRKGVLAAIDAVAAARAAGHDIRLAIGGSPTVELDAPALEARLREAGLADVTETCYNPDEDGKAEFLSRLDVFVYPSEHDHAPLALIEGLAHGLVPIVLTQGGIPEMVGPRFADNVIDRGLPADARVRLMAARIAALAADREGLLADRRAARTRYLSAFSEEAFEARLLAIFGVAPDPARDATAPEAQPTEV
ncbi:glycosyltransferase [Salinarimonas sp. NSM]|uniref:glycosyltransferase n=1 Tax=Salinarimonas sp. NSM TaxID=3458003 RepID=UPI004037290E